MISTNAIGSIDEVDYIEAAATVPHQSSRLVPKGSIVTVRGWATDLDDPESVVGVFLFVDGARPLEALHGLKRHDVAEHFADDRLIATGFRGVFSTARLKVGEHELIVCVKHRDGHFSSVSGHERFSIIDNESSRMLAPGDTTPTETIGVESIAVDGAICSAPFRAVASSSISIRGTALDPSTNRCGSAVFSIVDSQVVRAVYGLLDANGGSSGFSLEIPLDGVSPGDCAIQIRMLGSDASTVFVGPSITGYVSHSDFFSGSVPASGFATMAYIDEVMILDLAGRIRVASGDVVVERGDQLFFRGWAIDEHYGRPARAVHVCIDDLPSVYATYGLDRSDVVSMTGKAQLLPSGFLAIVPTAMLPSGLHVATLRVLDHEGRRYYETSQRLAFTVAERT